MKTFEVTQCAVCGKFVRTDSGDIQDVMLLVPLSTLVRRAGEPDYDLQVDEWFRQWATTLCGKCQLAIDHRLSEIIVRMTPTRPSPEPDQPL